MRRRTTVAGAVVAAALAAGGWFLLGAGGETSPDVVPADEAAGDAAAMGAGFAVRAATAETPTGVVLRIRGTVVDGAGVPLAGVRVTGRRTGPVYDANDPKSWGDWGTVAAFARSVKEIDAPAVEEEKPTVESKTGDDGAFLLETREAGIYEVAARVEAPRAGTRATANLTVAKPEAKVRLFVLTGSRLRGRVVDAADHGVPAVLKASWMLKQVLGTGGGSEWAYPAPTRSDASGEFAFDAVPAGKGTITVTLPGRMTLAGVEVVTPYEGTLVIRLGVGGVLRGRVADLQGQPVAGADVVATVGTFSTSTSHDPTGCKPHAKSDSDGTWRMEGVLPGKVAAMSVSAQGYTVLQQTSARAVWSGAEVRAGQETTIDLVVKKGGAVAGRVTEEGTGVPVPDVEMRLLRAEGNSSNTPPTVLTGADGRFRFDDVPLGKHVLLPQSSWHWSPEVESAVSTGNVSYPGDSVRSAPPTLTVVLTTEGETAERDLVMRRGISVTGRVVGADGAGVEGAKIRSGTTSNFQWQWGLPWIGGDFGVLGTSGADGAFELRGLPPRESWVLSASKESLLGVPCKPFRLAADAPPPAPLVLEMAPGASVAGRTLDADGKGLGGLNVWYWAQEAPNFNQTVSATTDPDGTFLLQGLPAGKGQLQVNGNGGSAQKPIDALAAAEKRTGVEIRLEKTAEITGTLVDPDGNPVAGIGLSAQGEGGGGWGGWTTTRADGTFTLNGRTSGKTRVNVSEPNEQGYSTSVPVGDAVQAPVAGLRLVYTPKKRTTVTGRVVDPAGKPVPLCLVATPSSNRSYGYGNPDEAVGGEFVRSVEGVPPLTLSVSAPRDAYGRPLNLKPKQVTVADPKEPLVVALEAGTELVGQVVGPDGKGVLGVTVRGGTVSTLTDEDGRFRVSGLAGDAEVDVTIQAPAKYAQAKPLKARPGDKDFVVHLTMGISISGRVVGPDGKGVTNAGVSASWTTPTGGPGSSWANVGEGGAFRLDGLAEDAVATLDVNVWSDGGSRLRPVHLTGVHAGATDVVIRMESGVTIEGRVFGPDGAPGTFSYVMATRVNVKGEPEGGGNTTLYGQAAAEGAFTIGGLEAGASYSLRVQGSSGTLGAELTRVTAPATGVRLVVVPPVTVTGRLDGMLPAVEYWVQGWPGGSVAAGAGHVSAKVAADGTFSLQLSADKDYWIGAGSQSDDRYALTGPVRPGAGDLVLRFQPGQSIEGRVEDLPAGDAWIGAKSDKWQASTKVEADGRFKVRGLPPGRFVMTIYANSTAVVGDSADAGSTGVLLHFKK